jgi:aerobic-type carbon monoxide dehydrogenase small subunit (CoxS/CutS family)
MRVFRLSVTTKNPSPEIARSVGAVVLVSRPCCVSCCAACTLTLDGDTLSACPVEARKVEKLAMLLL